MELTPDSTIFIQIAIFVAVWIGLRTLVFQPMQAVLAERNQRTVQAHTTATAMIEAAHADRARYEDALRQRRAEMAQEAEAARQQVAEESDRQIAATRAKIAEELAVQRAAVAAQVENARRTLGTEAAGIADAMLARVSGGSRR